MLLEGQHKLKKIVDKNFSLLHKNQDTAAYFNSIECTCLDGRNQLIYEYSAGRGYSNSDCFHNWNLHTHTPIRT